MRAAAQHPVSMSLITVGVIVSTGLDLAVAWGAAQYAWLKHTGGRRIGGGIARSYYVAVAGEEQGATSALSGGRQPPECVTSQGADAPRSEA